jgi:addiction module HigA family antidote
MSKSRSTTDKLPPVHPGEILKETLDDLGISMNRLSKEIHVPANRISSIIAGQRAITGELPCDWLDTSGPRRSTG